MWGNFGLFCSFSPKLPRIHVGLHCNANEKNWPWKGLFKLNIGRSVKTPWQQYEVAAGSSWWASATNDSRQIAKPRGKNCRRDILHFLDWFRELWVNPVDIRSSMILVFWSSMILAWKVSYLPPSALSFGARLRQPRSQGSLLAEGSRWGDWHFRLAHLLLCRQLPAVTSVCFCSTSDVIAFNQNWHHL